MKERFLFYWIELQCANITMRHEQRSSAIESNTADPIKTVEYDTAMPASEASHLAVFQTLVQFALCGKGLEYVLECRRFRGHRICLPNAERISSIPKCAVLLCTSRMGLISVISNETIFFVSAIISIARCASR